jgi:hypothetical protein
MPFKFLTGDVNWEDYGGKWYRQTSPSTYLVMSIFCWEEETGELGPEESTHNVELSEVDLSDEESLTEALRSSGWEIEDGKVVNSYDGSEVGGELAMVEAMHGYGCKAPLGNWNGSDIKRLMTKAGKKAALLDDPEEYEDALNRPVNAIGSTAREFQRGEMVAPILRGISEGNQSADLMLKMYVKAGGQTLGGKPWR